MSGTWHKANIEKGEYGEISKILEEVLEAMDAEEQGLTVMVICELSDIVGAVEGVAKKYNLTIDELAMFARKRSEVALAQKKAG